MRHVINIDEIELKSRTPATAAPGAAAEKFDARSGPIGARIGAQKLGYNLTAVPPGKRAFPFHNHHVNEEMFFILDGSGEVRIGDHTWPVRAGDIVACPPGGPDTAHQLRNTGDTELKYLAVSTKLSPELCEYPDSGKFGIMADFGKDANGAPQMFRHVGRTGDARDYWEGE